MVASTEFANSVYNCYLLTNSVVGVVTTRITTFVDFTDYYTSFLFNLLSESLSIETIATNLGTYYTAG